jgi:hypothetical protein
MSIDPEYSTTQKAYQLTNDGTVVWDEQAAKVPPVNHNPNKNSGAEKAIADDDDNPNFLSDKEVFAVLNQVNKSLFNENDDYQEVLKKRWRATPAERQSFLQNFMSSELFQGLSNLKQQKAKRYFQTFQETIDAADSIKAVERAHQLLKNTIAQFEEKREHVERAEIFGAKTAQIDHALKGMDFSEAKKAILSIKDADSARPYKGKENERVHSAMNNRGK